jgi:hypothetical protein
MINREERNVDALVEGKKSLGKRVIRATRTIPDRRRLMKDRERLRQAEAEDGKVALEFAVKCKGKAVSGVSHFIQAANEEEAVKLCEEFVRWMRSKASVYVEQRRVESVGRNALFGPLNREMDEG